MITSKSTDSSFIRYLSNVRAPTLHLSMFSLLINSCVSLRIFLLLTSEGEAQDTHFGLLLLRLIFSFLAGVTFDPKLSFL